MERPSFYRSKDFNRKYSPHVWQPSSSNIQKSKPSYYSKPSQPVSPGNPNAGYKYADGVGTDKVYNPVTSNKKVPDVTSENHANIQRNSQNNPSNSYICKPLTLSKGIIPSFEVSNANLPSEQEKIIYHQEKQKERQAVVNQPHRTFPMVQPKPKPIHDYPMGSYLRYVKDPNWQSEPKHMHPAQPQRLREVMNKINSDINKDKVVHLQYNSPINVYSDNNIAQTLMPQGKPHLEVPPLVRPVTPVDIRSSPTYQLVQEQENPPHKNLKETVHSNEVSSIDGHSPGFPAQSHTFNTLMTSLFQHQKC